MLETAKNKQKGKTKMKKNALPVIDDKKFKNPTLVSGNRVAAALWLLNPILNERKGIDTLPADMNFEQEVRENAIKFMETQSFDVFKDLSDRAFRLLKAVYDSALFEAMSRKEKPMISLPSGLSEQQLDTLIIVSLLVHTESVFELCRPKVEQSLVEPLTKTGAQ
nr:MAG TPA: hypothetical protein [Caudoviricetes sp.]